MTFMAQGHFPSWENLPFGDPVVVSSVVSMPLWIPAGVVTPKSLPSPLGVGKGLPGAPRMGGFIPACPAGRIPFWTSGLAWLVGSMAPESKGWKMRPAKICEATGWNEGRKQNKGTHFKASQLAFSPWKAASLGKNSRMKKAESEKIINMGYSPEEMPLFLRQTWC